jgi:hypothetical protein
MASTGTGATVENAKGMAFPSTVIEGLFARPLAILPDAAHS